MRGLNDDILGTPADTAVEKKLVKKAPAKSKGLEDVIKKLEESVE
jgi:hypothetical protein